MANVYTTVTLLDDILRSGHFPLNQTTFQKPDLLALADQQIKTYISPLLLGVRESYYTMYKDIPINGARYDIPDRAIGSRLLDVQLIVGNDVEQLARMDIGQIDSEVSSPLGVNSYYLLNNYIVLSPVPTYGVLRIYYHTRPSRLVQISECSQITAINTVTNEVTVSSLPSTFTLSQTYDFVRNTNGFATLKEDVTLTNIAGLVLTFSSLPDNLSIGDWVCLSEQTPIPQMPLEVKDLLLNLVVHNTYQIQGYQQKASDMEKTIEKIESRILKLITPRVEQSPKIIGPPRNDVSTSTRFGFNRYGRY
jgi:hypothetical protein